MLEMATFLLTFGPLGGRGRGINLVSLEKQQHHKVELTGPPTHKLRNLDHVPSFILDSFSSSVKWR